VSETDTVIVVGFVPKPQGHAALRLAVREAQERNDKVLVVNWSGGDAPMDPSYASEDDLAAVRSTLDEAGVAHEVQQLVGVDGAEGVLRTARDTRARLVIIGLRKRTAAGKFLFGSNAQRILMEAPCPVMSVRTDSDPDE